MEGRNFSFSWFAFSLAIGRQDGFRAPVDQLRRPALAHRPLGFNRGVAFNDTC